MANKFYGLIPSPIDIRDWKYKPNKRTSCAPSNLDYYLVNRPRIKNQGSVGSCVANSLSYIIENNNNLQKPISTGFIYGNRKHCRYKGKGMHIREALASIKKDGAPLYEKCPNLNNLEVPTVINKVEDVYSNLLEHSQPYRIKSYFRISKKDLKNFLYTKKNFAIASIKWYNSYKIKNSVISFNTNDGFSYHAITIVGWCEKGWIIANSWGANWGNNGFFILPYDYDFSELWGTIDEPNNDIKKKFNNKFSKKINNILNKIKNIF